MAQRIGGLPEATNIRATNRLYLRPRRARVSWCGGRLWESVYT